MNLFFDLDGTLTDPFEGITRSVVYALEKLGHPAPDASTLGWTIGPALLDSFAAMGVPDPQAALGFYRERYMDVGLFENEIYPGVIDTLTTLQAAGHRMYLMTAKPHSYARRITAHFGIAPFLAAEFGPEMDGTRNDKAELLAYGLTETGADPAQSVMIGDRSHDIRAARANGVRSVGVTWGYGTPDETGQADTTCDAVIALPDAIERLSR